MKKTYSITGNLAIKIGIVIVLLMVVSFFSLRWDFSRQKAYSLSPVSKETVRSLEDVMVVKVLSSKELPAAMNSLDRYTRDLLSEYQRASKGKFRYEYVRPSSHEELYRLAQDGGLSRIRFQAYENDQITTSEVIFGLIFEYQGKVEALDLLPKIEPQLEYNLTMRIQSLAAHTLPKVAVFRDTTYYDFNTSVFEQALSSNFSVLDTDLSQPLSGIDALLFTGTARNLQPEKLYHLDQYIMQGGKVVFLQDKVDTDGRHLFPLDTNVIDMLEHYGFKLSDDIVLDMFCDKQQVGLGNMVNYPMYPVLRGSDHQITQNIDNIIMYLASGISFARREGVMFEPILQTSEYSGWMRAPKFEITEDLIYNPSLEDFNAGSITTGALLRGKFDSYFAKSELAEEDPDFIPSSPELQMVLFGDKELVINSDRQIYDERSNIILNALDYLTGRESMIQVRSRHLSSSPLSVPRFMKEIGINWGNLEQIENNIKNIVKVISIALPSIILILIGLLMAFRRKLKLRQYHEKI
nr:gliding motility-associatede transport system auxiliary component [Candidatus Cloacimonadota bacterium]